MLAGEHSQLVRQDGQGDHRSGTFAALGHDFDIHSPDPGLVRYLTRLLQPLAVAHPASKTYRITQEGGSFYVRYGEEASLVEVLSTPGALVSAFLSHVNEEVIKRTNDRVLIHAAGAERDGVGLVLPAVMEAGKTTLVAGLIQRGFRYLTDEAVAIDPEDLALHPFPKPLSVDPGSWDVLKDLRPNVTAEEEPYLTKQWQVVASEIHDDALAGVTTPRLIVAPQYVEGAPTRLEPVSRGRTVMKLAESTFVSAMPKQQVLATVAELARRCDCYLLTVGNLAAACGLITDLIDGMSGSARRND